MNTQPGSRFIPVTKWKDYHPWPPIGGLRHLIFHEKTNGFASVVRRVGRRVLIDEKAFFIWLDEHQLEYKEQIVPRPPILIDTLEDVSFKLGEYRSELHLALTAKDNLKIENAKLRKMASDLYRAILDVADFNPDTNRHYLDSVTDAVIEWEFFKSII